MDLLKILRSFEEFIFEVTSWLFFYPRTLARIFLRPLATMDYSDREQAETDEGRYDDALSPPLLLLVTLVLANGIAWAAHVPKPTATTELSRILMASQQNLLLFRSLIFSLIPLVAALTLLRRQGRPVSRETLRGPFYAQCYLAAPCALAVSLGGVLVQRGEATSAAGAAVVAAATVWFLVIQTRWFSRRLSIGLLRAAATAGWAFVRAVAYLLAILLPIALF
ncbi:hypothetical protein LJR219_001070 [Phenylobacterium sp. LjRoot219]|uniref:hypothetical protein n=1 Tax=Phenylobacterium sp. LjRoot219 TaxID=3342283 RepID=UPI003ECED24F